MEEKHKIWTHRSNIKTFEVVCKTPGHGGYELLFCEDKQEALVEIKKWKNCNVSIWSLRQRKVI